MEIDGQRKKHKRKEDEEMNGREWITIFSGLESLKLVEKKLKFNVNF